MQFILANSISTKFLIKNKIFGYDRSMVIFFIVFSFNPEQAKIFWFSF
jgi:hypothetical protein